MNLFEVRMRKCNYMQRLSNTIAHTTDIVWHPHHRSLFWACYPMFENVKHLQLQTHALAIS